VAAKYEERASSAKTKELHAGLVSLADQRHDAARSVPLGRPSRAELAAATRTRSGMLDLLGLAPYGVRCPSVYHRRRGVKKSRRNHSAFD
jgi:hypothetical protein